jgi:hypothetical protein
MTVKEVELDNAYALYACGVITEEQYEEMVRLIESVQEPKRNES